MSASEWLTVALNAVFWTGVALFTMGRRVRGVDSILTTAVLGFVIIVVSMEMLSLVRAATMPALAGIALAALCAGAVSYRSRSSATGASIVQQREADKRPARVDWITGVVAALTVWTALDCLLYALLTPVQIDSDAPIYHLPLAIQWVQAGGIRFVPTPFGEEAAAYFPANGETWLAWLMIPGRSVLLPRLAQWPFLLVAAVALYDLARQSGAGRSDSVLVAAVWICLPLNLWQAGTANVDLIWAAFLLIAFAFGMRFRNERQQGRGGTHELVLSSLAAGCALGTKSIGLVYAPLYLSPVLWTLFMENTRGTGRPSDPRKQWLLAAGCIALPAAYWFGRNIWWTGNPVYPLDVTIAGRRLFAGWYDSAAMRTSAFHVPPGEVTLLLQRLRTLMGPCFASLFAVSIGVGLAGIGTDSSVRRRIRVFTAMALIHVAIYWYIIPYNTQERFLLPAFGLALIPPAVLLSEAPVLRGLFLLLMLAHFVQQLFATNAPTPLIGFRLFRTLLMWGEFPYAAALPAAIALAGIVGMRSLAYGRLLGTGLVLAGCLISTTPLARLAARHPELAFYPRQGFGERMFPAWQIVEQAAPPEGSRIAYAGGNLPYYLFGRDLRNEVDYININEYRDWAPHDYHLSRIDANLPSTTDVPWPEWDRRDADFEAWIANLSAAEIELVCLSRINRHDKPHEVNATLPDLPIERVWADAHPEFFERLGPPASPDGVEPWAVVYRFHPRGDFRTGPEDRP